MPLHFSATCWIPGLLQKEIHLYVEAGWTEIGGRDCPAVQSNSLNSDGQSKAVTFPGPFRPIQSKKRLEYVFQMLLWHAWAAISNREKHASLNVAADNQIDLDLAAWRTEADSVANDILARASECMRIGIFQEHGISRFQT